MTQYFLHCHQSYATQYLDLGDLSMKSAPATSGVSTALLMPLLTWMLQYESEDDLQDEEIAEANKSMDMSQNFLWC
jgi:hypothetical protein